MTVKIDHFHIEELIDFFLKEYHFSAYDQLTHCLLYLKWL